MTAPSLYVFGVPIWMAELPRTGDLKIWHPYNENVRSVIEPICRGKGVWNGEYNNWIVRRAWKQQVIELLKAAPGVNNG